MNRRAVLFTVLIITCMTAASEALREPEVIFPEIAAIATGALLAPRLVWKVNKKRIFGYIMLCAVLGMAIVLYCPFTLTIQMMLAFIVGEIILLRSDTSFAPMISAIVLPVMLQTRTPLYLVSAACFTGMILGLRTILEREGIRPRKSFTDVPFKMDASFIRRCLVGCIVIFAALQTGLRFMVAPPVLVAFTEFTNPQASARKKPVKAVALIALCAFTGAMLRYGITMTMGLPLTLAAFLGSLLTIFWISRFEMFLPPAAAIMLLSMLVPEVAVPVFPFMVSCGAALFMVLSILFFR